VRRRNLPYLTTARTSAAASDQAVPLCELGPGSRARIVAMSAETLPSTARRLADLGFTPGTEVEVVRRAPLRDPVIYRLRDYEVCLRRAQAKCVLAHAVA
jgi:ferrous iron transport protein A